MENVDLGKVSTRVGFTSKGMRFEKVVHHHLPTVVLLESAHGLGLHKVYVVHLMRGEVFQVFLSRGSVVSKSGNHWWWL